MNHVVFQHGLGFVEGPAWVPAGQLQVASIDRGCVYTLDIDGTILSRTPTGGGPNGLARSTDALYVAQNGGIFGAAGVMPGGVQVVTDDGVELCVGTPFVAPNDLCFGPDGRLWVTDPLTDRALSEPVAGRVFAWDPRSGHCEIMVDGRNFPNGIAFDATGRHLYLARTYDRLIERFRLSDGALHSEGVFCRLVNGRPDGLAVDRAGRLWICTPGTGGIEVFSDAGAFEQRIEIGQGSMTTNCCFGGEGLADLYVTAAGWGSVLRLADVGPGLPPYPFR